MDFNGEKQALLKSQQGKQGSLPRYGADIDTLLHQQPALGRQVSLQSYRSGGSFASWSRASSNSLDLEGFPGGDEEMRDPQPSDGPPEDWLSFSEAFSTAFVFCFGMAFFIGIIQNFPSITQNYFLKDVGASPGEASQAALITGLPWMFKPLYAFFLDNCVCPGGIAVYALFATAAMAVCFYITAFSTTVWAYVWVQTVMNVAQVFAACAHLPSLLLVPFLSRSACFLLMSCILLQAVVLLTGETTMVLQSRGINQAKSNAIQTIFWGMNSAGYLIGGLSGGTLNAYFSVQTMFLITFGLCFLQLPCILWPLAETMGSAICGGSKMEGEPKAAIKPKSAQHRRSLLLHRSSMLSHPSHRSGMLSHRSSRSERDSLNKGGSERDSLNKGGPGEATELKEAGGGAAQEEAAAEEEDSGEGTVSMGDFICALVRIFRSEAMDYCPENVQ